jgi:flagellar biogenesis protein FliO
MLPGADALADVEVPSLAGAALRAVAALAALGGLAWLALAWRRRSGRAVRQLEVLDRAHLSRGASIALVRAGEQRLVVGVSADGVRLLAELEGAPARSGFAEALALATEERR